MNYLRLLRIFSVLFALTVCSSYLHATVLTPGTTTITLQCTMGQACTANGGNIIFSATSSLITDTGTAAFTITAPSVPWLTVSPISGTGTTTTQNLTFQVTPGWTSLNAGLNTTTVHLLSGAGGNSNFTVNLQIQAGTPSLLVKGGTNVLNPVAYQSGGATPLTLSLTVVSSSGLPLAFTVGAVSNTTPGTITGGTAPSGWLTINAGSASGIAYSWGTTISFTVSASALNNSSPGDYDTATITITPAGQNAITVPVNIAVSAGAPTITAGGVSPALVPLLVSPVAPGFVNFVIKGTGFVSTTGAQKTKVFYGTTALLCTNQVLTDYVTVINQYYLQVAVPYTAAGVPFASAGATALVIGVANGASPAVATATASIGVTSAPIISGITSASSFVDAVSGTNPNAAPYDIISIFGTNLCPLCTGTNSVLVAVPDTTYYRFPTFVSPDGGTHKVTVTFSKPGAATTLLPGYLLFATNNQINVAVPGALSTLVSTSAPTGLVNVQVGYDTATPAAAANSSVVFPVAYAGADPGIFTIESSGQGQAAILDTSYHLNAIGNPAIGGAGSANVSIFMTGLGIPDAAGTNATNATSGGLWTAASNAYNCLAPTGGAVGSAANVTAGPGSYMQTVMTPATWNPIGVGYAVPAPAWTSIDGAIILATELNANVTAPCFLSGDTGATPAVNPLLTVTLVGSASTATLTAGAGITYAGFVQGSIAGLYQINITVPTGVGNGSSAGLATVLVTVGSSTTAVSSQAGVTMYLE